MCIHQMPDDWRDGDNDFVECCMVPEKRRGMAFLYQGNLYASNKYNLRKLFYLSGADVCIKCQNCVKHLKGQFRMVNCRKIGQYVALIGDYEGNIGFLVEKSFARKHLYAEKDYDYCLNCERCRS